MTRDFERYHCLASDSDNKAVTGPKSSLLDLDSSRASNSETAMIDVECGLIAAVAERILLRMLETEPESNVTLSEVSSWLHMILSRAQCAPGIVIVSYIYCERLLKLNKLVHFTKDNWKSITMTAVLIASKVWDDLSMLNIDFTYITSFSLLQINDWERAFLRGLRYNVLVENSMYEQLFYEFRARIIDESDRLLSAYPERKRIASCDLKEVIEMLQIKSCLRCDSISTESGCMASLSPSSSISTISPSNYRYYY